MHELIFTFTCIFIYISNITSAQAEISLYEKLQVKDKIMFTQGFDNCDLEVTAALMTEDVEFYHDQGGIDKGKNAFLETLRNGLCRTGQNEIRRHLMPDSLAVFPMRKNGKLYGAIQTGKHSFAPPGKEILPKLHSSYTFAYLKRTANGGLQEY